MELTEKQKETEEKPQKMVSPFLSKEDFERWRKEHPKILGEGQIVSCINLAKKEGKTIEGYEWFCQEDKNIPDRKGDIVINPETGDLFLISSVGPEIIPLEEGEPIEKLPKGKFLRFDEYGD